MNRYLRQVFLAYLLALTVAFLYVPWYGRPQEPWAIAPCVRYSPVWHSPKNVGYHFTFDRGRLFLEIVSLTVVMLSAALTLSGGKDKA